MPEDNSVTTHSLADLSQTMTVEPGISPCGDVHVNAKPWQELPRKIKPVITPGKYTTEYAVAQSANVWSSVGMIMGVLITVLSTVVPMAPANSKWAIIGGATLAVVSQIYDAFVKAGYIKGRIDLKMALLQSQSDKKE